MVVARRKLAEAAIIYHLIRADVCFPPFKNEVFDGITANNIVHHHPLNTLRQIFRRFNRVMRKGGTLLINEPCVEREECGLFGEMEGFVRHLWGSEELLGSIPENLREYLYHRLPIFGYGGLLYPTIMREILTEAKFETEILEQTFPKLRYEWMFHEAESAMNHLKLTESERKYLLDKIEEFKEKINMVDRLKAHG